MFIWVAISMSIDLTQFHQIFYEESFEGLDVMESALMALDLEKIDDETINAIFRCAHSIKGGSATFGFSSIAEFTHDLETILDQVRSGKRQLSSEEVNVFLQSVDCMREMLQLMQAGENGYTSLSDKLKRYFSAMLNNVVVESVDSHPATSSTESRAAATDATPLKRWRIIFSPNTGILRANNDVVQIFRELSVLGQLLNIECETHFPRFDAIDPEDCYLAWRFDFESAVEKSEIEEVFAWVVELADLSVAEVHDKTQWCIKFSPGRNILKVGNDPIRLFSVLREFGDLTVNVNQQALPTLTLLDYEQCYLSWVLTLSSKNASGDAIKEVFEWVLDESELDISEMHNTDYSEKDVESSKPLVLRQNKKVKLADDIKTADNTISSVAKARAGESGSIRVGIDKVDNLINMVGELVITQSMLGQLSSEFDINRIPKLMEGLSQLEQNTRELQESVMRIRMLPISFAFSRFPRMVRDLGQSLGKIIHLEMLGEQTELDKSVMEKIGDPLIHLVRNAIDHGIETPDERIAKGKSELGVITLNAFHQSGNLMIEVADDGRGLDRSKIVEKAIERGIFSEGDAEHFSDEQVFDLIFQPGFSTVQKISDISGRGVGMDVVKRNIQALNGTLKIISTDMGSKFVIRLPLTLAILEGQLVRVGRSTYIFPLVSIVESLQLQNDMVSRIAGGYDVLKLRDDYIPIVELYKTFSVAPSTTELDQSLIVVVECDGEKIGVVVDELLEQQQVVIKSLEKNYRRVEGVSGATILGDGTVALILDIYGIVKLAGEKFGITQSHHTVGGKRALNHQLPLARIVG